MGKPKYTISFMLCVIGSFSFAQVPADYIRNGLESNPNVQAKYLEFEASLQKAAQVGSLPDPTFSMGVFIQPVETRVGPQVAKLSLSQMFPWFGTLDLRKSVEISLAEAKYQEFRDAANLFVFQLEQAYIPLIEVESLIKIKEENQVLLRTYYDILEDRYENGSSKLVDILRTDIYIKQNDTELKILNDKLDSWSKYFFILLNQDTDETLEVVSFPEIPTIQQIEIPEYDINPKIIAIDLRTKSESQKFKLASKLGSPNLGFGLDYIFVNERSDMDLPDNGKNAFMPMASISIPIFRSKIKARKKESELKLKALQQNRLAAENELKGEFEIAQFESNRALDMIELSESQILESKQTLDLLYTAYSNSGADFEEVLRMQQQILKYETERIKATSDFFRANSKLNYLSVNSEIDEIE